MPFTISLYVKYNGNSWSSAWSLEVNHIPRMGETLVLDGHLIGYRDETSWTVVDVSHEAAPGRPAYVSVHAVPKERD